MLSVHLEVLQSQISCFELLLLHPKANFHIGEKHSGGHFLTKLRHSENMGEYLLSRELRHMLVGPSGNAKASPRQPLIATPQHTPAFLVPWGLLSYATWWSSVADLSYPEPQTCPGLFSQQQLSIG